MSYTMMRDTKDPESTLHVQTYPHYMCELAKWSQNFDLSSGRTQVGVLYKCVKMPRFVKYPDLGLPELKSHF